MFNLILKRMLLSIKVPQLCPLVLCFQYHKVHRVSNHYNTILHLSHMLYTATSRYAVNFSETVSDDISNTVDIFLISLVLLSFMHVCCTVKIKSSPYILSIYCLLQYDKCSMQSKIIKYKPSDFFNNNCT